MKLPPLCFHTRWLAGADLNSIIRQFAQISTDYREITGGIFTAVRTCKQRGYISNDVTGISTVCIAV